MNSSSMLALSIAIGVIWWGVIGRAPNPQIFLDPHALLIVLGGTAAAFLFSNPLSRLSHLAKIFFLQVLCGRPADNVNIVADLINAAVLRQNSPSQLLKRNGVHPFLTDGYRLIAEGLLSDSQLYDVLRFRSQYFTQSYWADAKMLNSVGKFPPAFGLLGASTGMIAMMTHLGSGGTGTIGPSMAVALVATFWGIAISNFVILPLADHMARLANDDAHTRQIIVEGLMMIKRREHPLLLAEKLNGLLPIDSRIGRTLPLWKAEERRATPSEVGKNVAS